MAVEKPQARPANESRAGTDGRMRATLAEKNGSAEPGSPARRGKRRKNAPGNESPSSVQRFFLTKDGANGIPELDHEVEDDEIPGVVVSRINLSPRFMRELIDAMEDNYSKWRTREGIKSLPEYEVPPAPPDEPRP